VEKLKDYSVLNGEKNDQVLHGRSFEVNMRLLNTSPDYLQIMLAITDTMQEAFNRSYEDYNDVQGISGPNVGIPLRIIGLRIRKKENNKFVEGLPVQLMDDNRFTRVLFMLNPEIVAKSSKTYTTKSNCGSLILKDPVEVERHEWVRVFFFDFTGGQHQFKFKKPIAATIQHEIDHLDGVLILDKQIKEKANDS
jgi:peptide deformylase